MGHADSPNARTQPDTHDVVVHCDELLDNLDEVVFSLDTEGVIRFINQAALRLYGYKPEELVGRHFTDFIHPDDAVKLLERFTKTLAGDDELLEYRIIDAQGDERQVRSKSRALLEERVPVGITGVLSDQTPLRRVEDRAREGWRRLKTLMGNLPGIAYRCLNDDDFTMVFLSEGCEAITGYSAEALTENRDLAYADLIHPDDLAEVQDQVTRSLERSDPFVVEYRIIDKTGRVRWVWERGVVLDKVLRGVKVIEGFILDITERKTAEVTLQRSEERARAILAGLPLPTLVLRHDGAELVLTDANQAAQQLSSLPVADMLNRPVRELAAISPALVEGIEACCEKRAVLRRDLSLRDEDTRQDAYFEVTYGFLPPDTVLVHLDDVTEQRFVEAQLLQAQKMEAVGRLAGGVAHDFNNLLTVINYYAESGAEELHEDDPLREELLQIAEAGDRAAALTRQLLAFSRKQVMNPVVVDLNEIIGRTEKMLRRLIGEDVELVTHLEQSLGRIKIDPGQLEQVLMNLAVNARDAMPTGGRLTIATMTSQPRDESSAEQVLITVSDTGHGMDPTTLERIFDPFFTTKELGRGTGLGLSTVHGIVHQSKGSICVESEPGRGTSFHLAFPVVTKDAEKRRSGPPTLMPRHASETVLVVEDEDRLRSLVVRHLRKDGYDVLAAADGGEAFLLCEAHEGPIHLVITDVVMPHMSGPELVKRLAGLHPEMKVLFMSGFSEEAVFRQDRLAQRPYGFLPKPFTGKALRAKLVEVLDQGNGEP